MLLSTVLNFLSAMALSALIGAERELAGTRNFSEKKNNIQFGGIRTHMLIGLTGALGVYMSEVFLNQIIFLLVGSGIFLLLLTHYLYKVFILHSTGLTTTVTGFVTFFLGALCIANSAHIAVMIAITVTVILLSKRYTQKLLEHIDQKELADTLKFAAILFVILPILPDTAIDPWGLIVPQTIWQVVVLISGISFVGYVLTKLFGQKKGVILSGVLGGLASSTAVTSSMAEQSKATKASPSPFVIATVIASCMMFFRVLFWVFSFHPDLVNELLLPVVSMGTMSALVVGYFFYASKRDKADLVDSTKEVALESPFQLVPAIKFALFFLFITILSELSAFYLGEQGTYVISFIAGFADVDAITVTLSGQALTAQISMETAARGIIIAMITNTIVKIVLAKLFGGKKFSTRIFVSFSLILLAGAVSLFFI